MKFLICGDLHNRGTNPQARTDEFQAALDLKLEEVFKIATEREVAAIIQSGDVFDSPAPSYSVFGRLVNLLRQGNLDYMFAHNGNGVHFLTVPGNHDLFGHSLESRPRTAYGALWDTQIAQDLSSEAAEFYGSRMLVEGSAYTADTDTRLDDYLSPARNIPEVRKHFDVFIRVAHGMALADKPGFEMRHTLLQDIANHKDSPDVLIVGHEHLGFGAKWFKRGDGTEMLAINPGALCRLSAHPGEISRSVQVCLLDVHGKQDGLLMADVEMIPLKSARPGHEVLSREHLEAQAAREERMAKFLDLLVEEGELKFLEVREIVETLARTENLPDEIVKEALRRIGRAREEIDAMQVR